MAANNTPAAHARQTDQATVRDSMNDLFKRYDILYTIVFFLIMIVASYFSLFSTYEDDLLGYRHVLRWSMHDSSETAFRSQDMVFVNTDEGFYDQYGGFPLRRKDYGVMAQNLRSLGAKVVGVDALFDYKNSYGDDVEMAQLFGAAGNVLIVSTADIDRDNKTFLKMNYPIGALKGVAKTGYSNIGSESALKTRLSRLRVFPAIAQREGNSGWPFAVQALAMYLGHEPKLDGNVVIIGDKVRVPLDRNNDFLLDFARPPGGALFLSKGSDKKPTQYALSAWDLLHLDKLEPDDLEGLKHEVGGKIVLVGDTSEIAHDEFDTPIGTAYGVEIIAHEINTLLNNAPLRPLPFWLEMLVSFVLLALLLSTSRISTAPSRVLVTFLLLVAYWALAFWLYIQFGVVMAMVYNTVAVIVGATLMFMRFYFASDENLVASERESAESNRMLALAFQGQSQLDMAFDKFRKVPLDEPVADLVYNLALDYERKRQFNKAVSVYEYLRGWNPNYRDIQQRINRAAQIEANPMKGQTGSHSTLIQTGGEGAVKPMLGRYEVTKELGQGAMGTVYLGEDPKINRTVAIKTMSLAAEFEGDALIDAKDRFFREAQSAGRLNHPNIVAIYDAGEEHDLAYIAMEFLKGTDLSKHTAPGNLLPLEEVLEIGIQCAEALDYAHRMGVVHRDVKPSNMMYDRDTKTVKLTDFGIARITDSSKTRTGTVLGTPNYMSPEQALGDKVDGRSDLFSLGVVVYQMCCGRLPFQGESMASLMYKIVNEPHPDIKDLAPDVPGSVRKVIDNALRKQPDRRYQAGAKLAEHLRVCKERLGSARSSA